MPRLAELVLGLVMLLGSVVGLIGFAPVLLQGTVYRFPGEIMMLATVVLYGTGAWAGLLALRRRPGWVRLAKYFWLAQVPAVSSGLFSVVLSCGAGAWLFLKFGHSYIGAGASAYLGSAIHWTYDQYKPETALGINVIALTVSGYLLSQQSRTVGPSEAPSEA